MQRKIILESIPYYGACIFIHLIGIFLLLSAYKGYPAIIGLGILAYTLGLRHAFDADHIAAIDNTVRKLLQQGRKTQAVGFYFSLGHSTIVLVMSILVGISAKEAKFHLSFLENIGGKIGSVVSGSFLLLVASFNLMILFSLFKSLAKIKNGNLEENELEKLLNSRGFLNKILKPVFKVIKHSWQMYPVGFLFGLGFDTASEIALLAISATASKTSLSLAGILSLPILFASGMCLMDTTDSVMMSGAYSWAFKTPIRKAYYNVVITSISVIAAFLIGSIELLQVLLSSVKGNEVVNFIERIDFGNLGIFLVILFSIVWLLGYLSWKLFTKNKQQLY